MRSRSSGKGNEPGHAISQTCGRVMLALDDIVLVRVAEEITHAQPPEVVITFLTSSGPAAAETEGIVQHEHTLSSTADYTEARSLSRPHDSKRAGSSREEDRSSVRTQLVVVKSGGGLSSLPVAIFSDAGDAHRRARFLALRLIVQECSLDSFSPPETPSTGLYLEKTETGLLLKTADPNT
jgi:hypothetical protein